MYCDFFGLRCRPFEDRADAQFFYATSEHEEALATIEYEARYGTGAAMLLGEAGTGKTLVVRTLIQRLEPSDHVVVLTWPAAGRSDLIRETCKAFGVSLSSAHQSSRSLSRLRRHLKRIRKGLRRSVLIVDQAQHLTQENLSQLETLIELHQDRELLLSIILVGQPRFRAMLDGEAYAKVRQKLFGERVLPALTQEETAKYIAHRLKIAGAADATIFEPGAVERIYKASSGIPRLINRSCHSAMVAAFGASERTISAAIVEDATSNEPVARSAEAKSLGLSSSAHVERGWSPKPTGRQADAPAPQEPPRAIGLDPGPAGELPTSTYRESYGVPVAPEVGANSIEAPARTMPQGADAVALAERLEQAIARAERLSATTEASVAQHAAVEKHLESLTMNAKQLIGGLSGAAQRAAAMVEETRQRIDALSSGVDVRWKALDERLSRAMQTADELDEQTERATEAWHGAEHAQAKLASFSEQLADKADDVQERIGLLMTTMGTVQESQNRLETVLEEASSVDARITHCRETCESMLGEVTGKLDALGEQGDKTVADANEKISRLENRLATQQRDAERGVADLVESATARCREALERLENRLAAQQRDAEQGAADLVESATTRCRRALEEQLDSHMERQREMVEEAVRRASGVAAAVDRAMDALTKRRQSLHESLAEISQGLDDSSTRATHLGETVGQAKASIEEFVVRVNTADAGLSKLVLHAEKLIGDGHETCGELQAISRNAATTLVDVKRAVERADAVCAKIHEHDGVSQALLKSSAEGASVISRLEPLLQEARHLAEGAASQKLHCRDQIAALEERLAGARELVERLDQSGAYGHGIADGLIATTGEAERLATSIAETINRLTAASSDAQQTTRQLDELVTSAGQWHESLHGLAAHADQKIDRLGSHFAAATEATSRLSKATVDGHELLEQLDRTRRAHEEAHAASEQLVARISDASKQAESAATKLSARTTDVHALVERLDAGKKPAEMTLTALEQRIDAAKKLACVVGDRCEQAGRLMEKVGGIARTVDAAKTAEQRIKATLDGAQDVREQLAAATESAVNERSNIEELNAVSNELAQRCDALRRDAGDAAERLGAQLTVTQESLNASEPILREYEQQINGLRPLLAEMDTKCNELYRRFTEASTRPSEIIAAAQAQTAQLETVCSAVRKVFAGLSKASLEANEHTSECRRTSEAASERLKHLTDETNRAAGTLHEWVQEAARVQARLESLVDRAPTIRETHPGESLRRISTLTRGIDGMDATGIEQELRYLGDAPSGDSATDETPQCDPDHAPEGDVRRRAEEVCRLIEDAKNAAVPASQR